MRVQKISIRNILGIKELEFEPGAITVIQGPNGVGKTSTLEAIRTVIEGGHDATLVRNGAESGEVVILLDDLTEIRKRVGRERSSVSVSRPDVGEVKAPQGYIGKLADALSVNPVAFLTADPKRQAQYLLESLPLELDDDELFDAVDDAIEIPDSALRGHPLDVLSALAKRIYDERTGVNRAAKEKKATVAQLAESLPVGEETDASERLAALEQEDTELGQRMVDECAAATRRAAELRNTARAAAETRMEELRRQMDAAKEALASEILLIDQGEQQALQEIRGEISPRQEEVRLEKRALQERAREADRHENTRRVVAQMQAEVSALDEQSKKLTAALEGLERLKVGLLQRLPIKGLEVVDGVIQKDGVPFARLNRAEQVKVAIQLAQLRAGELKLICVDGLECLDGPTFEVFRKKVAQTDLQVVVTRVDPDPESELEGLSITAEPAAVG